MVISPISELNIGLLTSFSRIEFNLALHEKITIKIDVKQISFFMILFRFEFKAQKHTSISVSNHKSVNQSRSLFLLLQLIHEYL